MKAVSIVAEKKEKRYVSDNAQLMDEWDWEKNNDIDPSKLMLGSGKKVWWKCNKGHSWEEKPNNRTSSNNNGCPYCSNHRVLVGYNDLSTTHPNLAFEWHPTQNGDLIPEQVTLGSNKKVWWICSKQHEYEATVSNRTAGRGCPFCSGKKVIQGTTDLLSKFPDIAKEWHPTKNGNLKPDCVSYGSDKKAWWICPNGHTYSSSPNARTSNNRGCPYCNGHMVLKGFNDLKTLFPQIAIEWCHSKNDPVSPDMIFPHSKEKYWWVCPSCKTEYLAAVSNRTNGTGCPKCSLRHHSSFAEQAIFFYISKCYPDATNRYTDIFNTKMELDIYIPSLKIGVEYDGAYWHNSKDSFGREQRKYKHCQKLGINLIRIREKPSSDDNLISDYIINSMTYRNDLSSLNIVLEQISKVIPLNCDFDVLRDESSIKSFYYTNLKEQSISVKFPQLAGEWDYERNGTLTPNMVSSGAADKVWWKCNKGHSWLTAVYNRTKGSSCPYCSGNIVISRENDLETLHPDLMLEWDYNKNDLLDPKTLSSGSNKQAWWKCNKGHSWKTSIYNRAIKNTGCPYCSNNLVWPGYNDLQTLYPQLADEWNYRRNFNITPSNVVARSTKKVWWKCSNGHEWEAQIRARVRGNGCPECSKEKRKKNK